MRNAPRTSQLAASKFEDAAKGAIAAVDISITCQSQVTKPDGSVACANPTRQSVRVLVQSTPGPASDLGTALAPGEGGVVFDFVFIQLMRITLNGGSVRHPVAHFFGTKVMSDCNSWSNPATKF